MSDRVGGGASAAVNGSDGAKPSHNMSAGSSPPTHIGTVNHGRVHIAEADSTLFCTTARSITHKIGPLIPDSTAFPVIGAPRGALLATAYATLSDHGLPPHRLCARCRKHAEAYDRDTTPRLLRVDKPGDLGPQARDLIDILLHESIAKPGDDATVLLDIDRTGAFIEPILNTPVGTGGDRKTGALILSSLLVCGGRPPGPATKPVPGDSDPSEQALARPITGGLTEIARRTSTGAQVEGECHDCGRTFNKNREIVAFRALAEPNEDPVNLHPHCVELRIRAWANPNWADRWTVLDGGYDPHVMAISGKNETRIPVMSGELLVIVIDGVGAVGINPASSEIVVSSDDERWTVIETPSGVSG